LNIKLVASKEDQLIANLAALAIGIHILESALPSPLPGVKPGFANIITLMVFLLYGWRMALWVSLLRVFVGSLVLGTFLSPTFLLSLSGALCSLLVLGAISCLSGLGLSAIGLAVLAAMAHMLGQFVVAYYLFIPHHALFNLLPILLSLAIVFGWVSGFITQQLLVRISGKHEPINRPNYHN